MNKEIIKYKLDKILKNKVFVVNANMISHNNWEFDIQEINGKIYHIVVNNNIECNCNNFTEKKLICKHIYFIINKILKNKVNESNITIFFFKLKVDLNVFNNPKLSNVIKYKNEMDKDCAICLNNFINNEIINYCKICKNLYHENCINIWLRTGTKCDCPLCRNIWI